VFARVVAEHAPPVDDPDLHYKVSLVECPSCNQPLAARQALDIDPETGEYDFTAARRVWPDPEREVSPSVPRPVRSALEEAKLSYSARAYSASAAMVRKTVEEVCRHFGAKGNLAQQLIKLRNEEIIDKKIFDWADALRQRGNLGVHAGDEPTTQQDAQDLLDFAEAICEYVFVLAKKFERFKQRTSGPLRSRQKPSP